MTTKFHVVVFGATGFTGKLVFIHLLKNAGPDVNFAIAGRSKAKLESLKAELSAAFPKAVNVPTIVAEADDETALRTMVKSTQVVLSTTGPYLKYGKLLVKLCAENGTDYCDLTGEVPFINDTINLYHEVARKSGARIVTCSGFDSVPTDLGTYIAIDALAQRGVNVAKTGATVDAYVTSINGGISGGTLASADGVHTAPNRATNFDPYALCTTRGKDSYDTTLFMRWVPFLRRWATPFIMASINAKVVRRSNELLGHKYGPPTAFSYSESQATSTRTGILGAFTAALTATGFVVLCAAMAVGPIRRALLRLAPQPGEGPSQALLDNGHAKILVRAEEGSGEGAAGGKGQGKKKEVVDVEFNCRRDPGYADTSVMIAETALGLAFSKGTGVSGCVPSGVLTPASALGKVLQQRLERYNITWTVKPARSV